MKNKYYSFVLIFSFQLIFHTLKAQESLVGTYTVSLQGVATGAVATIQKSGYQYLFALAATGQAPVQMTMQATEYGLVGVDNGTTCVVVAKGSDAVFQYGLVYTFILTRSNEKQNNYSNNANYANSNQIDSRLVGSWKFANTKTTGTGYGHTFSRNITFFNDGTCIEGTGYYDSELNAQGNSKGNKKQYTVKANQVIIGSQSYYYSFENSNKYGLLLGLRTSMNEKEMVFVKN